MSWRIRGGVMFAVAPAVDAAGDPGVMFTIEHPSLPGGSVEWLATAAEVDVLLEATRRNLAAAAAYLERKKGPPPQGG